MTTVEMQKKGVVANIFLLVLMKLAQPGTVDYFGLAPGMTGEKGTSTKLLCAYTASTAVNDVMFIQKGDTNKQCILFTALSCYDTGNLPSLSERYIISRFNNTAITVSINSLLTSDGGSWDCKISGSNNISYKLVVTALPKVLQYTIAPNTFQDLASTDVHLECSTDCSYPQPNIDWFYRKDSQTTEKWPGTATASDTANGCTEIERLYRSALVLRRYSTDIANANISVQFQCGIISHPGMTYNLTSPFSVEILFAVKVTTVVLRQGSASLTNSTMLNVTSGENATLTCLPSMSRPPSTLSWFIGNSKMQSGLSTTFTFIPNNSDNGKQVYCHAYNFEKESLAVYSEMPSLYVKVKVNIAKIMDGEMSPVTKLDVISNQEKMLTCFTGTTRPNATVVWHIGTKELFRSSQTNSFSFIPTNADHDKEIYCTAFNLQPENEAIFSLKPKLYVKVPAVEPSFSNTAPGAFELLTGEEAALECVSSFTRPVVNLVWRLGSAQLNNHHITIIDSGGLQSVKSVLRIIPNNTNNGETIFCETYVDGQNPKPRIQHNVTVYWPPSPIRIIPHDSFPWFDGNSSSFLECVYSDGNPVAVVAWNTTTGSQDTNNPKHLQMPTLTPKHNNLSVQCTLSNEYTKRKGLLLSTQLALVVEYYPVIRIDVDGDGLDVISLRRTEGQRVNADCSASGNPVPVTHWRNYKTKQLILNNINRTDDGLYDCVAYSASTKFGNLTSLKQLTISIFYAPDVKVEFSNRLEEQIEMKIRCNAVGKPDSYNFINLTQTWNGKLIRSLDMQSNGEVVIAKPTIEDSGNYTCFVDNGIRDKTGILHQKGTAEALLKGRPKFTEEATSFFAGHIGNTTDIRIPFFSSPGVMNISFRHDNGSDIGNSSKYKVWNIIQKVEDIFYNTLVKLDGYVAVLLITNVEEHDFGNYTLVVQNEIGINKWFFRHSSRSKPLSPTYLELAGIKHGLPIFVLGGGFNGGLPQTFIIEISATGTNNWLERLRIREDDMQYKLPNGSYLFNITDLGPQTYTIRVLAENELGKIDVSQGLTIEFVIAGSPEPSNYLPVTAIGAGIGSAVLVILAAVVALIIWKRRKQDKGTDTCQLAVNRKKKQPTEEDSSDEDVMVENKMYESAGQIMTKDEPVYNKPLKQLKIDTKSTDVYAVVDKSNKKKENQKVQKEKPKQKKKIVQGDIYENAPEKSTAGSNTYGNAAFEDNPYENPEASKPSTTQKKNINQEGLIYADLAFNDQPKGQKKLVIHGLDEMTTYVQVDFNKKADPLPDSDTEEQSTNKKN